MSILSGGVRKYLFNTSWLLIEKFVLMGLNFIVMIFVARYLGPIQFGLYNYSLSFVMLFAALSGLGLESVLIKEITRSKNPGVLLGTAFGLKLLAGIVIFLFIVIVMILTEGDSKIRRLVMILAIGFIFESITVVDFYYQARVLSKYSVLVRISAGIITPIIRVSLILMESDLIWFAVATVANLALIAVGYLLSYHLRDKSIDAWFFSIKIARQLLEESWPLIISGIFISIYMRIDQIMLKMMLDTKAVGYYAVGVRIAELPYFIPTIIAGSLFPAIINARDSSARLYQLQLEYLYSFLILVGLAFTLSLSLFGEDIINILFGLDYSSAGPVIVIYSWAIIPVFLGGAKGKWTILENQQQWNLAFQLMGVVTNIVCNLLLIPILGIKGAAWATLIAATSNVFLFPIFVNRQQRKHTYLLYRSLFFLGFFHRLRAQ